VRALVVGKQIFQPDSSRQLNQNLGRTAIFSLVMLLVDTCSMNASRILALRSSGFPAPQFFGVSLTRLTVTLDPVLLTSSCLKTYRRHSLHDEAQTCPRGRESISKVIKGSSKASKTPPPSLPYCKSKP